MSCPSWPHNPSPLSASALGVRAVCYLTGGAVCDFDRQGCVLFSLAVQHCVCIPRKQSLQPLCVLVLLPQNQPFTARSTLSENTSTRQDNYAGTVCGLRKTHAHLVARVYHVHLIACTSDSACTADGM